MNSGLPKVSVMISAYNEEKYIIESLRSILAQSFKDIEILVADDGSSDNTYKKILELEDPRIVAIRQENKGKAATLNGLIARAKGKYVMIQDGDDISATDRIQTQYTYLENNPHLAMVLAGHSLIIDDKTVAPRAVSKDVSECAQIIKNLQLPAHDPTLFVKRDIAQKFLFDESLRIGQGVDFIFRVAEAYPMAVIGEVLYHYRIRATSITKADPVVKAKKLFDVMNKAKTRRGEAAWSFEEFLRINGKWANDKDNNLSGHFTESAYLSVMQGRRLEAIRTALVSLKYWKNNQAYLKPAVYALLPKSICRWGKRRFGQ